MPIQIAPDDCDLELGRPCEAGILSRFLEIMDLFVPANWAGVWFNDLAPHWRIWRSDLPGADTHI